MYETEKSCPAATAKLPSGMREEGAVNGPVYSVVADYL